MELVLNEVLHLTLSEDWSLVPSASLNLVKGSSILRVKPSHHLKELLKVIAQVIGLLAKELFMDCPELFNVIVEQIGKVVAFVKLTLSLGDLPSCHQHKK